MPPQLALYLIYPNLKRYLLFGEEKGKHTRSTHTQSLISTSRWEDHLSSSSYLFSSSTSLPLLPSSTVLSPNFPMSHFPSLRTSSASRKSYDSMDKQTTTSSMTNTCDWMMRERTREREGWMGVGMNGRGGRGRESVTGKRCTFGMWSCCCLWRTLFLSWTRTCEETTLLSQHLSPSLLFFLDITTSALFSFPLCYLRSLSRSHPLTRSFTQ